jgi:hypothetical protein
MIKKINNSKWFFYCRAYIIRMTNSSSQICFINYAFYMPGQPLEFIFLDRNTLSGNKFLLNNTRIYITFLGEERRIPFN